MSAWTICQLSLQTCSLKPWTGGGPDSFTMIVWQSQTGLIRGLYCRTWWNFTSMKNCRMLPWVSHLHSCFVFQIAIWLHHVFPVVCYTDELTVLEWFEYFKHFSDKVSRCEVWQLASLMRWRRCFQTWLHSAPTGPNHKTYCLINSAE